MPDPRDPRGPRGPRGPRDPRGPRGPREGYIMRTKRILRPKQLARSYVPSYGGCTHLRKQQDHRPRITNRTKDNCAYRIAYLSLRDKTYEESLAKVAN